MARIEIGESQIVSFYPGLGEIFTLGSKLTYHPEGMEGSPLGCQVVQTWYAKGMNKATQKIKQRFIMVVEFIVSVGDELVFVADKLVFVVALYVYPNFYNETQNIPIKELMHRKLVPNKEEK
jgi:hypothetical protein